MGCCQTNRSYWRAGVAVRSLARDAVCLGPVALVLAVVGTSALATAATDDDPRSRGALPWRVLAVLGAALLAGGVLLGAAVAAALALRARAAAWLDPRRPPPRAYRVVVAAEGAGGLLARRVTVLADGRAAAEGLAIEVVEWVEQATVRTAAAERPAVYAGHALWAAETRGEPADDRRARPLPGVAPRLAPYVLSYRGSDGRAPVSSESGTLDA